jgi:hypothetical protein
MSTTTIVRISDRAAQILRANVSPGFAFRPTGTRNADGTWDVPFEIETLEEIKDQLLPGETLSDAIERIVAIRQ